MFTNTLDIRIKELETDLFNEQEKYVSSIKLHDNSATIKNIREDILARRFELEALYAQLK